MPICTSAKRRRRRPFLDRISDGQLRDQRQQRAYREENHAGYDRHVIAGYRQHVAKPGDEHRIVDRRCDSVAPTGQQRRRNGAPVAIERGSYARVDRIAQSLHQGRVTQ
jgi:hypothetical protein